MKRTYINLMSDKHIFVKYWNSSAFRIGYLDGLTSFAFLTVPYRPKPIIVPTVKDAWEDVGSFMSGAIMEFSNNEETKGQKSANAKIAAKR